MKVTDLIQHLERVKETIGDVPVLVDGYEFSLDELKRISLVKVKHVGGPFEGDYFQIWDDDDARGEQAVRLHAV